jgi:hypothetical protein
LIGVAWVIGKLRSNLGTRWQEILKRVSCLSVEL